MFARLMILLAIALSISSTGAAQSSLSVRDAWIREAPPVASTLAGYMVIENHGPEPRKLIAAESAAFKAIELHRTMFENGIARMTPQDSVSIPAGGQVALEPGGYHLMLIGSAEPLRAGDEVTVLLTFDEGERTTVTLPVKKAAGGERHHLHQ
jgi:copper(I)-binding protein